MQHLDLQIAHQLLAGQLSAAAQAHWQAHVRECPRCRDLLAAERELKSLLTLGDHAEPPVATPPAEAWKAPSVAAISATAGQRRRARLTLVAQCAMVVVLTLLLVWQVQRQPSESQRTATELHITAELQAQVVGNLGLLSTLETDAWLVEDGETVHTLEQLILQPED